MAKRLTDSKKWDDEWFLLLPQHYKLFWIFLLDKCDHAGIFKLNKSLADFCIKHTFNWDEVKDTFKGRIIEIESDKWFIPKYITFQYGLLDPDNKIHRGILAILKRKGIDTVSIEYGSSMVDPKVKIKVKAKVKIKAKAKDISNEVFIASLKENIAYKGINIEVELAKMDAWLLARPGRQKTRRFIINWLNKADKPMPIKAKPQDISYSPKGTSVWIKDRAAEVAAKEKPQ